MTVYAIFFDITEHMFWQAKDEDLNSFAKSRHKDENTIYLAKRASSGLANQVTVGKKRTRQTNSHLFIKDFCDNFTFQTVRKQGLCYVCIRWMLNISIQQQP